MLNHIVAKPVCKHFPGQRRYRNSCGLAFQDIAEVFEIAVAPAHGRVLELEGGDVGTADNFVISVHGAGGAVGLGVFNLVEGELLMCL